MTTADPGTQMITVEVPLGGGRSYPVLVGGRVRRHLGRLVPGGTSKVAVITQASIPWTLDDCLDGFEHRSFTVPEGEVAKELGTVQRLCSEFSQWGMGRNDLVVGFGGGVVTDLAGFAAAVYHRGINVIHVSTTLLGQVDAAIGGKTGVNLPEGKNLVGAFWQPKAVLADTETLATLPTREYHAGLGEMAKYRFLGVDALGDLPIDQAVAACVALKAEVVAADEREGGRRALLNYGHTLAHALETLGQYRILHGEAVAIGLAYAARLARTLGRIDERAVSEHDQLLDRLGIERRLPAWADHRQVVEAMGRDKKASGGNLTFVLDGPDGPEVVAGVDPAAVLATLGAMAAEGVMPESDTEGPRWGVRR